MEMEKLKSQFLKSIGENYQRKNFFKFSIFNVKLNCLLDEIIKFNDFI